MHDLNVLLDVFDLLFVQMVNDVVVVLVEMITMTMLDDDVVVLDHDHHDHEYNDYFQYNCYYLIFS